MTTVRDVMTTSPRTVPPDATLDRIAAIMRDDDTVFVPIVDGDSLQGAVTDRDIVIRAIADGKTPTECSAKEVATKQLSTISPDTDAAEAAREMRKAAVRRLAVVEGDHLVGVVSIGDLAIERDEESALADISAAQP